MRCVTELANNIIAGIGSIVNLRSIRYQMIKKSHFNYLQLNNHIGNHCVVPIASLKNGIEFYGHLEHSNAKYNLDLADNFLENQATQSYHGPIQLNLRHKLITTKNILQIIYHSMKNKQIPGSILFQLSSKPSWFDELSDRNHKYKTF